MSRARELGEAFDREFAAAARAEPPGHRDFLCIRIAGEPAAIPLGDVASLHADLRIAPLPTPAPELLGVAAIRAAVVPIYDLGAALGMTMTRSRAPRWAVVMAGAAAGFAVDDHDGHARVVEQAIAASSTPGHVLGQLTLAGQPRPILDLRSVLTAIETRWRPRRAAKEP